MKQPTARRPVGKQPTECSTATTVTHVNTCMTVALQIRDVPEDVRDAIAERAVENGQSVQAYLLALVVREAKVLRNARAFERTARRRVSIPPSLDPDMIIREGRDGGSGIDRLDNEE